MSLDIQARFNFSISGLHTYTREQHAATKFILTSVKQGQHLLQITKPHIGSFSGEPNRHQRRNAQKWFKAWFEKGATADDFAKRVRSLDFRTVCFNCHILPSTVTLIPDIIWPYTRKALLEQVKSTLPRSYRDTVYNNVLRTDLERESFLWSFHSVFGVTADEDEAKVEAKVEAVEKTDVEKLLAITAVDGADTKRAAYKEAAQRKKALRDTDFKKELKEAPLEFTKLIEKFRERSRNDNKTLEATYKEDLEIAARLDAQYNIHPGRAELLNSELISVVEELAELNVGFEEFALFQVQINRLFKEEISIPASVTLKASEAIVHEIDPSLIPPLDTTTLNPPNEVIVTEAAYQEDGGGKRGGPRTEKGGPPIALPTQDSVGPTSPALDAIQRTPTKSSNSHLPNKNGIGQLAPQEGGGESRGGKRKFGATSTPTPQGSQPSNGGGVSLMPEPVSQIDPSSAMSYTSNTGLLQVPTLIIELDLATMQTTTRLGAQAAAHQEGRDEPLTKRHRISQADGPETPVTDARGHIQPLPILPDGGQQYQTVGGVIKNNNLRDGVQHLSAPPPQGRVVQPQNATKNDEVLMWNMTAQELFGAYNKLEMESHSYCRIESHSYCRINRISSKEASPVRADSVSAAMISILLGDTSKNPAPWSNSANTFHIQESKLYEHILGRLKPGTELEVVKVSGSCVATCILPDGEGTLLLSYPIFLKVWNSIKQERAGT